MSYKVIENYLTINKYSRPGVKLTGKKGIVVHWTANPNSTALGNRNYFESLKVGKKYPSGKFIFASSQEIIDFDGTRILMMSDNEMAYHVGSTTYTPDALARLGSYPNGTTYGIECVILDWNGVMKIDTYNSLIESCANKSIEWGLDPLKDIWLHRDVVGWKDCHRWFVNNPNEYKLFLKRVNTQVDKIKNPYPQWKLDLINFLKNKGVIKNEHTPDEIVTARTLGHMLNNYLTKKEIKDPVIYLIEYGYMDEFIDSNKPLTLGELGDIVKRMFKADPNIPAIEYLESLNYISPSFKYDQPLEFWIFAHIFNKLIQNNIFSINS